MDMYTYLMVSPVAHPTDTDSLVVYDTLRKGKRRVSFYYHYFYYIILRIIEKKYIKPKSGGFD